MLAHKFLARFGLPFLLLIGGLHLSAHADAGDDICFPLYAKGGAVPGTGLACKLAASSIPVGLGTYFCTGGTDRIDRYCDGAPPPVAGSGNPPEPAGGMCKAGESVGHPILPATAEKYRSELDWADAGPDALAMRRIYRSNRGTDPARVPGVMGKTWTHSYSTHLTGTPVVAPTAVSVTSPEGYVRSFTRAAGASSWSASNNADSLTQAADGGWTYRRADDDATLQFGADGKLLTQSDRSGRLTTYSYNAAGQLSSVRNAFGRTLGFAYTGTLLTSVNTPDGRTIAYGYDTDGRLVSVTYPDGTSRRFAYENAAFANALTGLIDETGARYASFSYDALGRAVSTELAGATERYQVAYGTAAGAAPAPATVVDPLGTTRVYQYGTANGKLAVLGATLASGSGAEDASSRTQDANGLVTSETDFRGVRTDTTWDVARRLPTSVTEAVGTPEQRTTTTQWHPTLSLPVRITEPGRSTAFTYDAQGNLTKKTVTDTLAKPPEARTWKWTYTAQALVETETAPNGAVTRYTYDAAGNMRTATNALGHVTTYAYDSANRIVSITAPTGLVTTNTWDARGRLLSQAVTGMPATELTYNPTGTLATLRLPTGLQMSYTYDGAHRLTGWSNNRGESGSFTLDGMGNRTAEQIKDASGTVVWNALRSVNAINRVAAQTEGQSQSSTFGYDANGDRTSETNGLNQTTRYAMDALRRLSTIIDPQNASASLGYNALDGVVQAKDFKSTATSYTRDALGNATSEASPDSGMASTTYDRLGLPQTVVDAMGRATHITRDLLGRPTQLSYADGTQSTLLYDLPGRKFNAEGAPLASVGYLSEVQDAGVDTRFVRDLWGRVIRKTQTLADGQVRELAYRFRRGERHGAGLVRVIRYPSGKKLRHLYDATGRLTGLEWDGQPLLTHITWNPLGQPTGWSWPGFMRAPGDPAPLAEQRSYTDAGQLARSALLHITRDAAGRISRITQQQLLPTDSNTLAQEVALSSAYTYDSTGRLTASAHSAAGVALPTGWSLSDTIGPDSVGYAYDANGNRTQASYRITTPAGTDTLERSSAIASGSNRIGSRTDVYTPAGGTAPSTTTTTYPYDSAGDLTRHLDAYLFYDAQGRIAQASTRSNPQARHAVRYTYNSAGQRIEKTDARLSPATPVTQETVYAEDEPGSTILGQYANRRSTDSAAPAGQMDSTEVIYLPTASGPMPVAAEINGRLYAIHSDQLNTPRRLTNQQGQVAWQWLLSGFGELPPTTGANGYALNGIPGSRIYSEAVRFDLRYPGQVWDEETGLAYNLHRYYDAQLGRYVQSDPIGLQGGINTYAYVYGNPLMYIDPNGLFGWADMPTVPQGVVDFGAGLGDALLLGTGGYLRDLAGVDGGVDPCSGAYEAGGWVSFGLGAGRLAYAGIAKGGAILASSGAQASAFRQSLKGAFRLGGAKNWRPPDLSKYPTDAALRAAAGRTNTGMNAYGAGVGAAGAGGAMCGCPN